ncbi:MAG: DoxX family membrane protein [Acidimicrobiia bacterium]
MIRLLTIRLRTLGPVLLRISLAAVFIWFGALKVTGTSPVERLVVDTVPGADGSWFVPLLGGFEVALGVALLFGVYPLVVAALVIHLVGTFTVMITQPELAFQNGNPLLLTTEGEFVVKNLVLLTGALTIAGLPPRRHQAWSAQLRAEGAH